ncbi:MAG TPA: class I SAM-dependent methyltransferase [Leptolyngbyaceae cyanobacterium M33_DOE_097]|uniref:Class I SAM-dependent methyltransferase n=1 Tax=Oscillatoriales cyanobacterium SpSt-418 TaxID=2282169 RepID=A0A7C3PKU6_9CYAN|nr:class I SAM-dependent methyltransferase [Leptolyngbyaceae cyanobacterium M33_DOE_097]
MRKDIVWQDAALVAQFLEGVRGAVPFAAEQIAIALQILESSHPPLQRVADLGCGDGILAQAVLERYPMVKVVAIDFSAPMLEQAKKRLSLFSQPSEPLSERVQFVHADLYSPEWQQGLEPFDAIVSGYCIHHLPDDRKQALYQEIYRLLTPGGWFLNIEHVASVSPLGEELFEAAVVDRLYQLQNDQKNPASRPAIAEQFHNREDKQANRLALVEEQCRWLRMIGFEEVDCYFKFLELAVFGGRKAT